MPSIKLAVFDFDQTLSACHVYYALSGGDGGLPVPPPFAETERGQLNRMLELNASPEFAAQGGFSAAAFGGAERIVAIRALFADLAAAEVECVLCSRGLVGPIRRCLEDVDLLRYFTGIHANAGPGDGVSGSEYDAHINRIPATAAEARLLGDASNTGWVSKGRLVVRCMRERGLSYDEAVFVDDTASEIANVQGACLTIHVQPATGMGPPHLEQLRSLLACGGGDGGGLAAGGCAGGIADVSPTSQHPLGGPPSGGQGTEVMNGGQPQGLRALSPKAADDWRECTPHYVPPPPPPPPPPDRFSANRHHLAGAEQQGPNSITGANGTNSAGPLIDMKSFVNLGSPSWLWGGGHPPGGGPEELAGCAPSAMSLLPHCAGYGGNAQGSTAGGMPFNGSQCRVPTNLYRDDELHVSFCCWFNKGRRHPGGGGTPPPCSVM